MCLKYGFIKWLLLSNSLVPSREVLLLLLFLNWIFTVTIKIAKGLKDK